MSVWYCVDTDELMISKPANLAECKILGLQTINSDFTFIKRWIYVGPFE